MTTTINWGYQRADCRGDFALSLFLDDMDRLVTHYAAQTEQQPEVNLFRAQAAANKLLKAYENNAKGTRAFVNQSIEIKSVVDASGVLLFVPIFSSGLKQRLIALLDRSNRVSVH